MKLIKNIILLFIFTNVLFANDIFREGEFEEQPVINFTNLSGKTYRIVDIKNIAVINEGGGLGNEFLDNLALERENTAMVFRRMDGSEFKTINMRNWFQTGDIEHPLETSNSSSINNINISPNPANNNLNISFEIPFESNVSISVVNVNTHSETGLMENFPINGSFQNDFNISNLERGNYFIIFKVNGEQVAKILNKFGE